MNKMNLEEALDFKNNYIKRVEAAADYIRKNLKESPSFGIVLGSGLGELSNYIEKISEMSYEEIPHFPRTTVEGHEGKLIIGKLEGVSIIGLKGRKHYYEVADEPFNNGILKVVFPVHVLANLGIKNYFVTNASGGLNRRYIVGDIMIIRSHINLIPNPLLGRYYGFTRVNDNKPVWRFQPMNQAYDKELTDILKKATSKYDGHIHEGTYLGVTGPTYETEGESLSFRDGLKADAVGMSTTPEVIIARNRGMKVVGLSCITNTISDDGTNATNHEEVKSILESKKVKERLSETIRGFFRLYINQIS